MNVVLTGVTVTGNMGGTAMLVTAVDEVRKREPRARLSLLSIAPKKDRRASKIEGLEIVGAHPLLLAGVYLPLSILLWPLLGFAMVQRFVARIPYFRALKDADVVIDLCGIAFVDGRGLPLLIYNLACNVPALAMGVPVAKLAQALGPFKTPLNRLAARLVLDRCAIVVARGAESLAHLRELGIETAVELPDVSFCMQVREGDKARAAAVAEFGDQNALLIVASPSEVVKRYCDSRHIDFEGEFTDFLLRCIAKGCRILIVPHSLGEGASKNNDLGLSQRIAERLPVMSAKLVAGIEDPRTLRAIIGQGHAFIGCRFHSVVGALAMGVPSFVIGWSHKYREMAAMLDQADWGIDWARFSARETEAAFAELLAQRRQIKQKIELALDSVKQRAASNFDLAMQIAR